MTMYLSVTPHIEPTHTFWDEQGEKLPPRYGGATVNERAADPAPAPAVADVAASQIAAARALAAAAAENAANQEHGAAALEQALAAGDQAAAKAAVDGMWRTMLETCRSVQELGKTWNAVAATVAEPHR
jgi:hypothetical protein